MRLLPWRDKVPHTTETCGSRHNGAAPQDDRFALALEEARRGFDEQSGQFAKTRSTVGGLVAYGGVASSVLVVAPASTMGEHATSLLYAAASLFCLLAVVATYVLWPAKIVPGPDVRQLVVWADEGDTSTEMMRNLALHYDTVYQTNKTIVRRRNTAAMVALILFALTVLILAIRLTGV